MRTPIAMKRTIPMDKREPAKRPMRYEPTTSKGPMKRIVPVKNDAPTKVIKKNIPTNNSGAVVVSKPVLDKDLIKKVPDKKPPTVTKTSVKKTPEIRQSKSDVSKTNTTKTETSTSSSITKEDKDIHSKDKCPEEYQVLSPRLTTALDSELEDIMIKVWQELPDEPISKIEEHVVEKIRNEAGDDLRNVIGLNITKRLLNVQNSLYAKLIFKTRPEKGALIDFIKKYNLKTFKRISDESPIFAAQFTNYEDFDRVCKDGVVYCGQVKVNVKACYNYRTCPLNLRSVFSQHDKSTDSDEESQGKVKYRASQGNVPNKNKQNVEVQGNTRNENKTSTKVSVKTETTNVTKSDTNIGTKINKMIIKIEKEEEDRKNEKDNEMKESGTSSSNVQVAQTVTEQQDSEVVDKVDKSLAKIVINQSKTVKTETQQVGKENKKMDEVNKDKVNNLQILNTEVQATQMDNSKQKEMEVKVEATQDTEENLNLEKESTEFNESGTFDDQDVLEFISEGIVLDECSGSEIE